MIRIKNSYLFRTIGTLSWKMIDKQDMSIWSREYL